MTAVLLAAVGTLGTALLVPANADPEIAPVIARFDMNEAAGSATFTDSVSGLVGTVGADVVLDGTTHTFATHLPDGGYFPGHVNVVPASQLLHQTLNPGTGNFQFTIRYNTNYSFGNIMQKGQSTVAGGMWKLENPNRQPRCLFRGSNGQSRTGYLRDYDKGVRLTRGWHTITCVRTPTYVQMWIDGVAQPRANGPTGNIYNAAPFSIGGKSQCDGGVRITCDYFVGQVDYIEFRKTAVVTTAVRR